MTRVTETGKQPKRPQNIDGRAERLAAALRVNLRRRKEQERSRGQTEQKKPASGKDQGC